MSFINKSVNYSQTVLLKKSFLSKDLEKYNDFILKTKLQKNIASENAFLIPNNHKKFYLTFIIAK